MRLTAVALAGLAMVFSLGATKQDKPAEKPAGSSGQMTPAKNLQVLPKDISRKDLLQTMKSFALGLGVRCSACHVGEENQSLSTYDFASDDKKMKKQARAMMLMTQQLNKELIPKATLEPSIEHHVSCYTCHRGKETPEWELPPPPQQGQEQKKPEDKK